MIFDTKDLTEEQKKIKLEVLKRVIHNLIKEKKELIEDLKKGSDE